MTPPTPAALCAVVLELNGRRVSATVLGPGRQPLAHIEGRLRGSRDADPADPKRLTLAVDHQLVCLRFERIRALQRYVHARIDGRELVGIAISNDDGSVIELEEDLLALLEDKLAAD